MFIKIIRKMKPKRSLDLNEYSYKSAIEDPAEPLSLTQNLTQPFAISKKKTKLKTQPKKSFDHLLTLKMIEGWRVTHEAPVDVVGCERLADRKEPIEIQKYQTLVALMLSIQTKDEITAMVMGRLKQYGLKPEKIMSVSEQKMVGLIHQSNFNRRKAANIIEVSKRIHQNGLPKNKAQLLDYPGVGVKIAMIYLKVAEGVVDGIGVDTHVHRICNRLGWVNTKTPNETQDALQSLFPKDEWKAINVAMVGFGQILCQAKKPKCKQCPVAKQCPSYLSDF